MQQLTTYHLPDPTTYNLPSTDRLKPNAEDILQFIKLKDLIEQEYSSISEFKWISVSQKLIDCIKQTSARAIKLKDASDKSILHLALSSHYFVKKGMEKRQPFMPTVVNVLLAQGAEVNALDKRGKTPLHYACASECIESDLALAELINYMADRDVQDDEGNTPLHSLFGECRSKKDAVVAKVRLLLSDPNPAKVDIRNKSQKTALELTPVTKQYPAANELLMRGAKVTREFKEEIEELKKRASFKSSKPTNTFYAKLQSAYQEQCSGTGSSSSTVLQSDATSLNDRLSSSNTCTSTQPEESQEERGRGIKRKRSNSRVMISDEDDAPVQPPATVVGATKGPALEEKLLFIKWAPLETLNAQYDNGNTMLHIAIANKECEVIKALLQRGVNTNVENNNRETPMMLALANELHAVAYQLTE